MSKGEEGMLTKVMAAFARPTRLVKSQKVDPSTEVDDKLFEVEEERQLQVVYQQVASQVKHLQRRPAPHTPPHPRFPGTPGCASTIPLNMRYNLPNPFPPPPAPPSLSSPSYVCTVNVRNAAHTHCGIQD